MFLISILQDHNYLLLLAYAVALIIAISVHEFAHAYVAFKNGDPTAKLEGRLTLNPLAHLDPIGTLMLILIGFGWGKPVPVNTNYFKDKNSELKVAFAGIITNLIVAFVFALPIRIATFAGILPDSSVVLSILNIIVELNIILAVFNLLPIPPLDGSHLVEYFLSEEQKVSYQSVGPFLLIGIIMLDRLAGTSIIFTIIEPVIRMISFLITGTPSL